MKSFCENCSIQLNLFTLLPQIVKSNLGNSQPPDAHFYKRKSDGFHFICKSKKLVILQREDIEDQQQHTACISKRKASGADAVVLIGSGNHWKKKSQS